MKLGVDLRCLQDNYLAGVGEYAWQILRIFPQLDKSIELFGYANAAGKINLPAELESILKLQRRHLPNRINNVLLSLKLGQPIDRQIFKTTGKLDAFWFPNPSFINLAAGLKAVLTVHDLAFVYWPEFFKFKSRLWYFAVVKKLLKQIPQAKLEVVCVSQHTADDLMSLVPQIKPNKIRIIYPGVNESYFNKPGQSDFNDFRRKYNLPANYLLSLGTIEPRKNYELLLRAYAQILKIQPDFPYDLVIAGAWGWNNGKLKRLIKSYPYRQRLHILGYVQAADKLLLYSGASLFLYPSFYEGFGIPPLEAMASGTAVITSQTSSLPEVVGGAGLLLSPYSSEAWAEAILWLSQDGQAREKYQSAGRTRAQKFSWTKAAGQYLDYFKS
ncbi:MAG: glycosyltransferase family 4 protein [Candidatus Kerfeldbacteria bacterium]|nr:glycosyltransferase family 4 protein [Candidatus Kerfeldbacteria bacterium]